jgi:hypothetical protein
MSRITIVILTYHTHKSIDLMTLFVARLYRTERWMTAGRSCSDLMQALCKNLRGRTGKATIISVRLIRDAA